MKPANVKFTYRDYLQLPAAIVPQTGRLSSGLLPDLDLNLTEIF